MNSKNRSQRRLATLQRQHRAAAASYFDRPAKMGPPARAEELEMVLSGYSPGTVSVDVSGELTEETSDTFRWNVADLFYPDRDLILDLSGVRLITSAGMTELCRLRRRHHAAGGHQVFITGAQGVVKRALDCTGLSAEFSPELASAES